HSRYARAYPAASAPPRGLSQKTPTSLRSKSLSAQSSTLPLPRKIADAAPDRRRRHRRYERRNVPNGFGADEAAACCRTCAVVREAEFIAMTAGLEGFHPARMREAPSQHFTDRLHFHYRRLTSRTQRLPGCVTLAPIEERAGRCAICLRILRSTP